MNENFIKKGIAALLLAVMSFMTVCASDYSYLTFETSDGTKISVPVSGLSIKVTGKELTAGGKTFEISNLDKMYFTFGDETTTGIKALRGQELDDSAYIYDLQGHKLSKSEMHDGIYIVKTRKGTYKLAVK